jgi:hypothetical protein
MTDRQFCEKLEDAILELERRKALISRGLAHITLVKLHAQLMDIHNNFVDLKVSGGTRKSPFLICFYGGTGQSKSFITEQMTRALLTSAGVNADERLWYTKNPLDDYWSGFRSDMTTVNWDDFCQGAADKSTHNPWMDVFGLKGNQKFVANMADVESKGRVYGEPELLTMNTNSEWMQVKTWVTSPSAALRRIDYRSLQRRKLNFPKQEKWAVCWTRVLLYCGAKNTQTNLLMISGNAPFSTSNRKKMLPYQLYLMLRLRDIGESHWRMYLPKRLWLF